MPKPRTGTICCRGTRWRGAITTDAGRRYVYGRSEEEARAKLATLGSAPPASHRTLADSIDRRANAVLAILDRAEELRWSREFTSRVIATNLTRNRIDGGVSGPCVYCGSEFAQTVDHVDPLARGGTEAPDNLVSACTGCNIRKGVRAAP